ncbi:MAG TPA: helix-turn-helix transcriptional regulator [Actinophytocola sp.]|uniref:helix-turn-helix domain-containing protein n=1 Tax=Actinophytocola sp. TaxID=1872138 RepID=UPI002DDD7B12|nr:helix-turn-helix transcriptional regulator [Actinophytocola sp.]HEV2781157.1 helix-turn-helix transcriptional regulator [Actinophytocola sp.]
MVERRRLASELRRLRSERNRTIREVADILECSPGKISRIETGSVGARLADVRELLDIYEVHGKQRDMLLDLVRHSHRRAWWHRYAGVLPPESIRFLGLEDGASRIDEYSGLLVPGLVQTDEYLRALIGTATKDRETVERRIELRQRRRQILTKPSAPTVTFVLHEAALVALFGGPDVMARQLDHLVEMSALPSVTIRVLPLTTGEFAAAGASFTIFSFTNSDDPSIVHIEQLTSSLYREHPGDIDVYSRAFSELTAKSLDPEETRALIARHARSFRRRRRRG